MTLRRSLHSRENVSSINWLDDVSDCSTVIFWPQNGEMKNEIIFKHNGEQLRSAKCNTWAVNHVQLQLRMKFSTQRCQLEATGAYQKQWRRRRVYTGSAPSKVLVCQKSGRKLWKSLQNSGKFGHRCFGTFVINVWGMRLTLEIRLNLTFFLHMKTFLCDLQKRASLKKFGQKSFASQKFSCRYTYTHDRKTGDMNYITFKFNSVVRHFEAITYYSSINIRLLSNLAG